MTTQVSAEVGGSAVPERISFMSANYVARELGYHISTEETAPLASFWEGWGKGSRATNARFAPLESFGQCFEEILADASDMGFRAVGIWSEHLNWQWATTEHVTTAQDLLRRYNLTVTGPAGYFGETREEFEDVCRLARSLGAPLLQGGTPLVANDRDFVVTTLNRYGLKLGIQNISEKSPQEMLAKIDDGDDGVIGITLDTGWCGTEGYDAAQAIEELGEHVFHVHLKDVLAPGAHESCRYGQGCVPVERCVHALMDMAYQGYYCVEHETLHFDPSDDCRANLAMLRQWLRG